MWTLNRIINKNKTEAYFTCAFEIINENGETASFYHQYREEPTEEELFKNMQNHIDNFFNNTVE